MSKKIEEAINVIIQELKKDPDYLESWKSNIAMSFKDEYYNYCKLNKLNQNSISHIHIIANNSAINFLNNLMR